MSGEIDVRVTLNISKNNLQYRSFPSNFVADISGTTGKGPTPGAMLVTVGGKDVDLSQLNTPAMCIFKNLEVTGTLDYVTVGIFENPDFYPLMELLPGEIYIVRLSRNLGDEMHGTVGTTGGMTLRLKSHLGNCNVSVEAFEK
jgi:hypothetical protein